MFQANKLNDKSLLIGLILFRILNSLFVVTYFNPDEYWQSMEVAHNQVFGYGYLTWEWKEAIRGYAHPFIFTLLYQFIQFFQLDSPLVIHWAPRLLQGIFAAIGDFYLFHLSKKLFGVDSARWTLICNLLNWFMFYCIVRTFSNSLETVLTVIGLYYWPFSFSPSQKDNRFIALCFGGLSVLIRPTSAIFWAFLGIHHLLFETKSINNAFKLVFFQVFPVAIGVIALALGTDYLFYGKLVFVPFNFLQFNIVKDFARFYGTHPWHWYFSQGFIGMVGSMNIFLAIGVYLSSAKQRLLFWIVLLNLILLSFQAHKEFRFALPLLPICMLYCGIALSRLMDKRNSKKKEDTNENKKEDANENKQQQRNQLVSTTTNETEQNNQNNNNERKSKWYQGLCMILLMLNMPMILYFSRFHQAGPIALMPFLRTLDPEKHSVQFLTSCHSTPWYSSIHIPLNMSFWDCSPPLDGRSIDGYVDQSDLFKEDPPTFLLDYYFRGPTQPKPKLPSHFVVYSNFAERVLAFLTLASYEECASFYHAPQINLNPFQLKLTYLVVYCRK